MNEKLKNDLQSIKLCLDAAIQKGVFSNLEQAFTIIQSFNNINAEIERLSNFENGTNRN